MEQFPINQKESGINRVVGFEPEQEREFLQYFKGKFESNATDPKDQEKTREQQEMIERINSEMKNFLVQYAIEAIEISPDNVHVLDRSKITEEELKKIQEQFGTEDGFYSARYQAVAIMKDYDASKLSFLQTIVHEILHLQGFYSYQKSSPEVADLTLRNEDKSASMNIRRSGFSIGTNDGKRLYFHQLNESVITELQIRFEKAHMTEWPELEEEFKSRDEYIKQIAERDNVPIEKARQMVARIKGDKSTGYKWVSYPYHAERLRFNALVDELYKRNKEDFGSREDVFNLFADATLTGKLLPAARLVEKTFGKGSFRTIGERSADIPD